MTERRAGSARGLLVAIAGLALLTVAVALRWAPLMTLDHRVATGAFDATSGHAGRTRAWLLVSAWGGPPVVRGLMLLGAALLALRRRLALAARVLAVLVVEAVVAPTSKLLLSRPRPSWAHPITVVGSTSYPSGHAAAAFAGATAAVLLSRGIRRPGLRVPLVVGAVVTAALVAASRVLLGVHYLTDVCGGALLGAALALAVWYVAARLGGGRRDTR